MSLLLLSLVALGVGPLVVSVAGSRSWVLALVDGFVIVTIGGIALIHILPHAMLTAGVWALVAAAVGLFGPLLLERRDHAHHDDAEGGDPAPHRPAAALALLGIALHAFLDGSAFADEGDHHELLGLAVVLHRIPEGLAIWWLVRPRRGSSRHAAFAVALVAVATVAGARFGDELHHGAGALVLTLVQALVAGSLLHVIVHHAPPSTAWRHHHHHASSRRRSHADAGHVHGPACAHEHGHDHDHAHHGHSHDHGAGRAPFVSLAEPDPHHGRGVQLAPALGALLGAALLLFVSASHPTAKRIAHEIGMGATFVTLALESAPALLVAYVASGLVHAFLPRSVVRWLSRGSALSQSLRGVLVGPLLPVCSCGVLPLYRSMLARGTPPAAALTLLVAAPEIGLAAVLLSLSLLGPAVTLARAGAAIATALVVGYGVTRLARRAPRSEPPPVLSVGPAAPWRDRLWAGVRYGLGDTVDHTSPWIMLGLAVAAFAEPLLDGDAVAGIGSWLEVPAFAALGVPMYVCASGATPLVAVLLHKGVSPGAAVAFLLTGPATNLTTFGVLAGLHGRRLAGWFAVAMVVVPTLLGYAVNLVLPRETPTSLHAAAHAAATPLEIACLAVLAVLVGVSLVRHGPRHMVSQLVTAGGHDH